MTAYRFNPQAMRVVRQLRERHGLDDDGEVILRALALLDAVDEVVGVDGVLMVQGAPFRPAHSPSVASEDPAGQVKEVRVWRKEEMLAPAAG